MRVLGIDPGSRKTGYGVIDKNGARLIPVAYGTIKLGTGAIQERLLVLFEALGKILAEYKPTTVGIEGIFHAKNAGSALKLGHARGVALLAVSLEQLPIFEYAPTQVKKAVTSSGSAQKGQVQRMVTLLLGLKETPDVDAADALAVAICHAQTSQFRRALR